VVTSPFFAGKMTIFVLVEWPCCPTAYLEDHPTNRNLIIALGPASG
jgi:hypothetical protein